MSAAACARTASDLTTLVHRLDRVRRVLIGQSRLPEDDFGGLSGDAYRRHAVRLALTVADAGSDLALLAGALAALGRSLAAAEEIRNLAAGSPPERARELRLRARDIERHAQERWRGAVAAYEGRACPDQKPVGQPVVPGTVLGPSPVTAPEPGASTPADAAAPAPAPASSPAAPAAAPAVAATPEPEPVLDSALVIPPPELESELVVPPTEPARCGTPEVLDEWR
ncbi:MAG: hypothetical protein WKF50_06545 [Nocardioides sp.]